MAYFLPSYFQKRLLRYALSRLDFLESDALDLENLGITLGQRSVIELKNVGIKVEKLIESLQLPASVVPHRASIRNLHLTIPADLHVSGIAVEMNGVEVEVELDETKVKENVNASRSKRNAGISRTGAPHRSGPAPDVVHNPDDIGSTGGAPHTGAGHTIPTSEDLAISFLQTEPEYEKQELQVAIEARSTMMQQSTASLESSYDESGLGMPGGFSLPGFVATFLTGIADRLSVCINNIAFTVCLHISSDTTSSEFVKALLTLKELRLEALKSGSGLISGEHSRRSIQLSGLGIHLLSDADSFSLKSATSSPRAVKSRAKLGKAPHDQQGSKIGKDSVYESTLSLNSSPRTSSVSSGIPDFGLGITSSRLDSSHSPAESASPSSLLASNEMRRESTMSSVQHGQSSDHVPRSNLDYSPEISDNHPLPASDLAESRLFAHDEAESMYMSAMSNNLGSSANMPGGWSDGANTMLHRHSSDPVKFSTASVKNSVPVGQIPEAAENFQPTQLSHGEPANSLPSIDQVSPSKLQPQLQSQHMVAKSLLEIDHIAVHVPHNHDSQTDDSRGMSHTESIGSPIITPPAPAVRFGQESIVAARSTQASNMRSDPIQKPHETQSGHSILLDEISVYKIELRNAGVDVDMSVCRLLIAACSAASKALKPSDTSTSLKPPSSSASVFSSKLELESLNLSVHQVLRERHFDKAKEDTQFMPAESIQPEDTLLQLGLSRINHTFTLRSGTIDQRLAIGKFVLKCGAEKVLSFFDPSSVQESFVASSMVMEHEDLVIRNIKDRFDINLKPVYIKLDLLLIDDVLSRSGGLSSLLDLGNSLTSPGTVKDATIVPAHPETPRTRTVRFDNAQSRPPPEKDLSNLGMKINLRVSGFIIDLVGSEATVQVKTSSVKVVLRPPQLRTTISLVAIKGPILHNRNSAADVNIKLTDFQIRYLDAPEEEDLDRLLSLLTPSSDKYDKEDDIMVDTLLRQRRKGGVVRVSTKDLQIATNGLGWHQPLTKITEEMSKLSSVTKYLPEDDRPGILTFALVDRYNMKLDFGKALEPVFLKASLLEGAHITLPSLMAAQVSSFSISRSEAHVLFGELIPNMQESMIMGPPMLMCRFIADEMDPTVKVKLSNACLEYSVQIMQSVTNLVEHIQTNFSSEQDTASPQLGGTSSIASETSDFARKVHTSLTLRNTAIALNPLQSSARGLFVFTDAHVGHSNQKQSLKVTLDLKKGSVLVIDESSKIGSEGNNTDPKLYFDQNDQVQELAKIGFVPVGSISAAFADIKVTEDTTTKSSSVDVEFRNNLFFLETCADSTQTLIQILSGLSPPAVPSNITKYRTQIVPIQDMLASFTGNAFVSEPGPEIGLQASQVSARNPSTARGTTREAEDDDEEDEGFLNDLYVSQTEDEDGDRMTESYLESEMGQSSIRGSVNIAPVNIMAENAEPGIEQSIMANSLLDFRTDHFVQKASVGGTAHRWDSTKNTYGMESEKSINRSPVKVRVRDLHVIWNLFDGFDWQNTRDTISQAVQEIETKAMARQSRRDSRRSPTLDEDDESVIGDVLFNSIYISIPAHKDPRELTNAINQDLGDAMSETGSYATSTTVTATTTRKQAGPRPKSKRLRLNRSKQHKMTFELEGVSADFLMFPPGSGEVESSLDVRIRKLEIFDHVPTSTWKKFATYMHEAGEREIGTDMIHVEILNVKPIAELSASEIVMKATVLPLRLHVDQDALDFLTRFFEFKDNREAPSSTPSAPPFLQRVEVNPIQVRLDFKPKRVDYAGLRSGRTTEFMNFFILDRADMVLRRVILYGVSGFDRVGIMLNNIWMPDVKRNQLPGVLAGLAPIRSLVDVGSGVKDLIAVPIREYKKDGRIVRSIQKGALAFAKTTTTELVNLGAKLAIGTQTVLQNAEGILVPGAQPIENEEDEESRKQISLYADQPLGIVQGLRGAYTSLERDLLLAKDAIVAVPGEVMATGSATGAAKAVLKQSPTIILRPAIGVTKAMGQAFLGAGNTLDKGNRKRIEDKYKRY